MRTAKFHTIIYGETIPEIGSTFEKKDCLIIVQKEESGTEIELLYADGNGKVVTPTKGLGLDLSNLPSDLTKEQTATIKEKLKISDLNSGLVVDVMDIPDIGENAFTYITSYRKDHPKHYGLWEVGLENPIKGVNSVDLSINDSNYKGRFDNRLYQGNVEELRNPGTPGQYCLAAGSQTTAGGAASTALGYASIANGEYCYAEGRETVSIGQAAHAEGGMSVAEGDYSHAEGASTYAKGIVSHAEGSSTLAEGRSSHSEGEYTEAKSFVENARGYYNYSPTPFNKNSWDERDLIESVGGGDSEDNRKNLFERYKSGAFKWILKDLNTIQNPVVGLHAVDLNGVLNYYDSEGWHPYGGGENPNGGLETTKNSDGTFNLSMVDENGERSFLGDVKVARIGENGEALAPSKILVIPEGTLAIADNTFKSSNLTEVIIPDSVTSIGNGAFASNNLTEVSIPNSVTSIGNSAFYLNSLASVTIPNSVTSIGNGAFASNNLTEVSIPNSVTSIEDSAFYSNSLTSITIPNSVTSIGNSAFSYNNLTSITIPNSVTSIGISAFYLNSLTSITIPNSVTSIGRSSFKDNHLTSITIPDSVTYIDYYAFQNNNLTEVTLPETTRYTSKSFDSGVTINGGDPG